MSLTEQTLSVAQLLKEKTSIAHQRSEHFLLPYLNNIRSLEDYAAILKMFYGFFHPLEEAIKHHITNNVLPDIHERRNSQLILKDLHAIGHHEIPPSSHELPTLDSTASALGALYVLEGSTLGGRMIARMLMKQPMFTMGNVNFFDGYKEDTGKKWTVFQSVINSFDQDVFILVNAANETFDLFTKWMEQTLKHDSKN